MLSLQADYRAQITYTNYNSTDAQTSLTLTWIVYEKPASSKWRKAFIHCCICTRIARVEDKMPRYDRIIVKTKFKNSNPVFRCTDLQELRRSHICVKSPRLSHQSPPSSSPSRDSSYTPAHKWPWRTKNFSLPSFAVSHSLSYTMTQMCLRKRSLNRGVRSDKLSRLIS